MVYPLEIRKNQKVESAIAGIRKILQAEKLPQAANDARCRNCSLYESCMPSLFEDKRLNKIRKELFEPEVAPIL